MKYTRKDLDKSSVEVAVVSTAEELQEFYRLMRAKAIGLLSVLKETRKELQRQGVDVH